MWNLPAPHRDAPWFGDVQTRGKQLECGDWGATAVREAVTCTAVAPAMPRGNASSAISQIDALPAAG